MGKILFFDLDGTLWDREENIPSGAADALRRARRNGHRVFVNTGRTRVFALRPALYGIALDGLVTGCGTRVECPAEGRGEMTLDAERDRVLYDRLLPPGAAETLIGRLESRGFRVLAEGPEAMYADMDAFRDDPYMLSVARRMGGALMDLNVCRGRLRVSKVTCDTRDSPCREQVIARLSEEWNVFRHNEYVCELAPPGHDKAEGMRRVCRLLGASMADTVAFGDGANDAGMLRAAAVGVAMEGGAPEAAAAADVTAPPVGEDGVRRALARLGLI